MNRQTVVYVVRHGQAQYNLLQKIAGTKEPNPLTELGQQQAHLLSKKFKNILIDKIYSSDLTRAKMSAQIIANKRKLKVEVNKLLRERYWGSLQGKTFDEAKEKNPIAFEKETKIEGQKAFSFRYVKNMESLKEAVNRFRNFLNFVIRKQKGKTILVVCHFDIMVGYLAYLGHGTYQSLMNASFDHAGYYKLVSKGKDFEVKEVFGLKT